MNSLSAPPEFKTSLTTLVRKLNVEKIGLHSTAMETLFLLRKLVCDLKWADGRELIEKIHQIGSILNIQPISSPVRNMICRVMKIIREEHLAVKGKAEESDRDTLQKMVRSEETHDYLSLPHYNTKNNIIDAINEVIQETETTRDDIAASALEHIHSNEVIMTSGYSRTVEAFLKKAASKKRKFSVIVAESAPSCQGHKLAASLADNGIETTIITDAAIYAMMSCVNKIIIGTNCVLANGGLKAPIGSYTLALAAKQFSVPVLICAARYKISPQYHYSSNQANFNKCASPLDVLNWGEERISSEIDILNPLYDYVPPELVTLIISDQGGYAPSYVYRLLSDLYHPEDLAQELESFT